MIPARHTIRGALRRVALTERQAQLVRLLLREDRRQREAAEQLLAECRRDLRQALAPPQPDSLAILELSVQERLLQDRQRALTASLEQRIAALLRPEQAVALRRLAPAGAPLPAADQ